MTWRTPHLGPHAGRLCRVLDDGTPPPEAPVVSRRIGLSAGVEHEWRWHVAGDPNVSGPRNVEA